MHLLSTYAWGIQLSVQLFDGFRRGGRMDEQRAASDERLGFAEQELAQGARVAIARAQGTVTDLA